MTSAWVPAHLTRLVDEESAMPLLDAKQAEPVVPHLHLWDPWPIQTVDSKIPDFGGVEYWMALSAPRRIEPSARHDVARIRLLAAVGGRWDDRGNVFPDNWSQGSREWAGSAAFDGRTGRVTVRYTAAGRRDEAHPSFVQRIFEASSPFEPEAPYPFPAWTEPVELVEQGGPYRSTLGQLKAEAGRIKGFRDPSTFRDPVSGVEHLLITASLAGSSSDFDGVVGLATRTSAADRWHLRQPLLHADGVNNELERPHVVFHEGLYYAFFSTQAHMFHPDVEGPTGLYGFVAESMAGEWTPVNGSGLVLRNPIDDPYQCYSWLVLHDLRVASFVDMQGLGPRSPDEIEAAGCGARHFGGTPSPLQQITLKGDQARLVSIERFPPH